MLVSICLSKVKLFGNLLFKFVIQVKVKSFQLYRLLNNMKYPVLLCDIDSPAIRFFIVTLYYFCRVTPTRTASNIRKLKAFFGEKVKPGIIVH